MTLIKGYIHKLSRYGFGETFTKWITDFRSGRTQTVSIQGKISQPAVILSGVPQGSALWPLQFILYLNEIQEVIQETAKLFADDTKVFDKERFITKRFRYSLFMVQQMAIKV